MGKHSTRQHRRKTLSIHWGRTAFLLVLAGIAFYHLKNLETTLLLLMGLELK